MRLVFAVFLIPLQINVIDSSKTEIQVRLDSDTFWIEERTLYDLGDIVATLGGVALALVFLSILGVVSNATNSYQLDRATHVRHTLFHTIEGNQHIRSFSITEQCTV